MNGPRILVIDDEPQIHRFLKPALEAAGYAVDRADDGRDGVQQAGRRVPDAILLDLGLPDLDGQEVLLTLRAISHAPILVVSARDRDDDKVRALDAGADDYVQKPFAMPELLARLRACLRRALVQEGVVEPWRGGSLVVDLLRRLVLVDGKELMLTPREYDLLAVLVRNAGRVITYGQLLSRVWGAEHSGDKQYVRVYIGHLRQKLGPEAAALIRTEAGIGYRLIEPSGERPRE
ncbi:MAG: response regulator transcription factor [Acetobacteraceae bacterium]